MGTLRLYLDDPWLDRFEATVLAHARLAGRPAVVLDRSAFYPEAGGQLGDRGTLAGLAVLDVQRTEEGSVLHLLDAEPPPVGARVVGELDRLRRREHMALHTGQHLLSQALLRVADARTISSRLGETDCTVDVACRLLGPDEIGRVEAMVHDVVERDVPIRCFVPTPQELVTLPLRRSPKVEHDVRVVQIGDFDLTPCGGTHCTSAAQVGLLQVLAAERYKGLTRVHFVAGPRARRTLGEEARTLRRLGHELSAGPFDVPHVVAKLRTELAATRARLAAAQDNRAARIAAELRREQGAATLMTARLEAASLELLRAVAARLGDEPNRLVLLGGADEQGLLLFAGRGEGCRIDCGQLVSQLCRAGGGRGGGRGNHAEGRLPAGVDWPSLVLRAQQLVDAAELAE